jgi:hypothetical protein
LSRSSHLPFLDRLDGPCSVEKIFAKRIPKEW